MYSKGYLKLKLKFGVIEEVEDFGEKLYKMKVSFDGEKRQIIAGIRKYFKKEDLIGKRVLFLYNIEPKKLRGEYSQGMLLVGEDEYGNISLIEPFSF